jgi:hypothetical protein
MIAAAILLSAAAADPISGTWEGTSLCQVKPSPCHDEHVIYKVNSTGPRQYRIDAYKLVGGQQVFMGAIDVTLDVAAARLDGKVMNGARLQLDLKDTHLSGRMIQADGTLYRLIEVTKR